MPVFKNSRYRKTPKLQIVDADGVPNEVYETRDTTMAAPETARAYTTVEGDTLQSIATDHLGDPALWWVIADMNPLATFYPLDLPTGTDLMLPTPTFAGLQR